MPPAPLPARRALLAATCSGVALAALGRAALRAASPAGAPDITWRARSDGSVVVSVSGVCARAWRCGVFGPPCSRGELRTSVAQVRSSAEFELGALDAGHYCVRVERADTEREALAVARFRHAALEL